MDKAAKPIDRGNKLSSVLDNNDFKKVNVVEKEVNPELDTGSIDGSIPATKRMELFSPIDDVVGKYRSLFMDGSLEYGDILKGILNSVKSLIESELEKIDNEYSEKISSAYRA